jgi:hypothetical protein
MSVDATLPVTAMATAPVTVLEEGSMPRFVLSVGAALALSLFAAAMAQAECRPQDECTDGNCRKVVICTNSKEVALSPAADAAGSSAPGAQGVAQPGVVAAMPPAQASVAPIGMQRNVASYPGGRSRR